MIGVEGVVEGGGEDVAGYVFGGVVGQELEEFDGVGVVLVDGVEGD